MEPGAKKPSKEAKGTEPASRSRLGEFLVEQELITAQVLQEALQEQRQSGRRIGEILLDRGHVTEAQLIPFLTNRLKLPYTDVSTLVLRSDQLNLIPETLARKYTVLPVRLDGKRLDVVMADPMDHEAIGTSPSSRDARCRRRSAAGPRSRTPSNDSTPGIWRGRAA